MTNMEYIQQMKVRGLTEFLLDMDNGEINYAKHDCSYCHETDCDECMDWWLGLDTKEPQGLEYEEKKGSHEWISVKDRLPEEPEDGLQDLYDCAEYIVMVRGSCCPTVLHYVGGGEWYGDGDFYNVTHWMELPELPGKEGESRNE